MLMMYWYIYLLNVRCPSRKCQSEFYFKVISELWYITLSFICLHNSGGHRLVVNKERPAVQSCLNKYNMHHYFWDQNFKKIFFSLSKEGNRFSASWIRHCGGRAVKILSNIRRTWCFVVQVYAVVSVTTSRRHKNGIRELLFCSRLYAAIIIITTANMNTNTANI